MKSGMIWYFTFVGSKQVYGFPTERSAKHWILQNFKQLTGYSQAFGSREILFSSGYESDNDHFDAILRYGKVSKILDGKSLDFPLGVPEKWKE